MTKTLLSADEKPHVFVKFKLSEVDEWIRSGGAADDRDDEKTQTEEENK